MASHGSSRRALFACLLPLLFLLLLPALAPCDARTVPLMEGNSDMETSSASKTLDDIVNQLDHQIEVLHEQETPDLLKRTFTVQSTTTTESPVKEMSIPSSLIIQEAPVSSSYSLPVDKLNKISPNMHMKGAGTKEDKKKRIKRKDKKKRIKRTDKKKRTLLPDLKQDNSTGNDGKSVRTPKIIISFEPSDNSRKTQIDFYNIKDLSEVPKEQVVTRNVINQGVKTDTVVLKENGLQVDVNVKYIPEKERRKDLIKFDHGITGKNTAEDSTKNSPITGITTEDLKKLELLNHTTLACVIITGLILAVIVFALINASLCVNKKQVQNANISKKGSADNNKITEAGEKGSHLAEHETVDIENQNNSNLIGSPPAIPPLRGCEDVKKPFEVQTTETISLINETEETTPLAEPFNARGENVHVFSISKTAQVGIRDSLLGQHSEE